MNHERSHSVPFTYSHSRTLLVQSDDGGEEVENVPPGFGRGADDGIVDIEQRGLGLASGSRKHSHASWQGYVADWLYWHQCRPSSFQ